MRIIDNYSVSENLFYEFLEVSNIREDSNLSLYIFDLLKHLEIDASELNIIFDKNIIKDETFDVIMSNLKEFERKKGLNIEMLFL